MPVTIKDIAKAAGVSHTTVSRALQDNSAISAETTARIKELAREMGYTPSAVAQSLLSQRTLTIGMVVTTIADPFIVQIVEGVERIAKEAGYSVFLSTSNNDPDQEIAVVDTFQRRRVDAIIVTSSRVGSLYSSQLDKIQVPIVLINNQEEGDFLHTVAVDDVQGAQLAVEHLLDLGHSRIAYVGAANRPKSNRRRQLGYEAALKHSGVMLDPELFLAAEAGTDLEWGQVALDLCLAVGASAVFCYNDIIAIGFLMACRQRAITIPQELSVVGFDDIEPASYVTPSLTTIRQPRSKLGQLAMMMVLDLLNEQQAQDQSLACDLIVRESTAAPTKVGS